MLAALCKHVFCRCEWWGIAMNWTGDFGEWWFWKWNMEWAMSIGISECRKFFRGCFGQFMLKIVLVVAWWVERNFEHLIYSRVVLSSGWGWWTSSYNGWDNRRESCTQAMTICSLSSYCQLKPCNSALICCHMRVIEKI